MFLLTEHLAPDAILCGCRISSRDDLLREMAATAGSVYSLDAPDEIAARVIERESRMTTAIGLGIAVPHARLERLDRVRVVVACVPAGLDFHAPDRKPVRLALLLVSPMDAPGIHVQALAAVSRIRQELVDWLVGASGPAEFLSILAGWEAGKGR